MSNIFERGDFIPADLAKLAAGKNLDWTIQRENGDFVRSPSKTDGHLIPSDIYKFGSAGWDYQNKRQVWVAIDFDDKSHSCKNTCSDDELQKLREDVKNIPFVQARWSTVSAHQHHSL